MSAATSELVDQFLEYACADPILANGPASHARRSRAALRLLNHHPEIARANIHTAVVCGDIEEVNRILNSRPEAATEPGGPNRKRKRQELEKLWTPLLHLCYGRLPIAQSGENVVAIARVLLNHGADPDDYFEVGSHPSRYSALCGVAGEGEDDAPPHPQREALARLLLERGAAPYQIQVFYNTHFHGDVLWLLKLIYEQTTRDGRGEDWNDPEWSMIDEGYARGARFMLHLAISKNNLELARWCLDHGASPNPAPPTHPKWPKHSLHEEAVRAGFTEMADLLVEYGATPSAPIVLEGIEAFVDACLRVDRAEAQKLLTEHPEYLLSHEPIFTAACKDNASAVDLLIDLGTSVESENEHKRRPLHEASGHNALRVAELLIERGAEVDSVESIWNATPLGFAIYGQKHEMIDLLSRFSRDIWELTFAGQISRLRELLTDDPNLAKAVIDDNTPLMWLTDDEPLAIEIAELLIACGADPNVRNKNGMTAADYAEGLALYDLASFLRAKMD